MDRFSNISDSLFLHSNYCVLMYTYITPAAGAGQHLYKVMICSIHPIVNFWSVVMYVYVCVCVCVLQRERLMLHLMRVRCLYLKMLVQRCFVPASLWLMDSLLKRPSLPTLMLILEIQVHCVSVCMCVCNTLDFHGCGVPVREGGGPLIIGTNYKSKKAKNVHIFSLHGTCIVWKYSYTNFQKEVWTLV